MNHRHAVLLSHESIATPTTKTLDVTLKDIISRLCIQVKATNNTAVPVAHPASIISKIEIVDGSDVLFGLSGQELLALQFYNTRRTPFCINMYLDTVMNITTYEIYFGRFLYDPILALDPTKFTNLQIKITHNIANGGSGAAAGTLEVTADIFDQQTVTPIGFLMAKENVSYTLITGANEYVDLPTDYTLRKLIVMSLVAGKQPWELYNEVKLSEDNDRRIPLDDKTSDLLKYMGAQFPRISESIEGATADATKTFYMMSTYEVELAAIAMGFTAAYLKSDYMYGGTADIRASAACNFKALITGGAPFGSLCLPFGKQDDHENWYSMADIGSLRLTIKAGTIAGTPTCEVLTEQLRTY